MTAKQKNIIWIFGDQHRGQALSCRGDINVNTPNLDRMATDGQLFPNAVAGYPLCCPFRGSLITGRYPHKCVPGHEYPLPAGEKTIAHTFKENGYNTAWLGKWHLGGWHEYKGRAAYYTIPKEDRGGFDTWIGYENNNAQYDCWVHGHNDKGDEIERYRLPGYETDCLTDMLIDNIRQHSREKRHGSDTPFFTAMSVQPPHDPYIAPAEYMARHNPASLAMRPNVPDIDRVQQRARRELAGAYAMIENLDYNIGCILAALEEENLAQDTIIIFFSDHGDMHGSQGQFRKTSPYAESVSIPFIIYNCASRYDNHHYQPDATVNHVDIAPTTLGLCGIEKPEWMEGFDYSNLFIPGKNIENLPDSAYLQLVVPTRHGDSIDRPWRGITTRDGWKYVCLEHQPWLMFNLNEDPYEQVNLAFNSAFQKKRQELHNRLCQWVTDTDDTFALPVL